MTYVRSWILADLKSLIPNAPQVIYSDVNPREFKELTGLTHNDLLTYWEGPIDPDTKLRTGKGTSPTFTTCTSFLPIYASRVRLAGGLPISEVNRFTGKSQAIGLKPFKMNQEKAWVANNGTAVPQPGDFFLIGTVNDMKHVGIILNINGTMWEAVAGGAGGKRSKRDGVKRTAMEARPEPVLGWLDVDVYFNGWESPQSIYDD